MVVKAEIENIGPIVRGAVELSRITVFAGPNNSGKSIVSRIIYCCMVTEKEEYVPNYVMAGGTLEFMRRLLRSDSEGGYARVNANGRTLSIELFKEKDPKIKLEGSPVSAYYVPTRSLSIMFLMLSLASDGPGVLAARRGEIVKEDMQNRFGIEPERVKGIESVFMENIKRFLIPAALLYGLDATVTDIIPLLLLRDYTRNKQVGKIEEELLGGKVLPELAYEDDLRKVSLHLFEASSGVQELWAILPILHQAMSDCEEGKRVFVFIDEPEAHLHPPAQVKFGEWFVDTCQNHRNINFVLSTHSDILLGAITRKSARDECLEMVSVYGFDMDEDGSVTVERKEIYSGGEVKGIKGFSEAIESITWL